MESKTMRLAAILHARLSDRKDMSRTEAELRESVETAMRLARGGK